MKTTFQMEKERVSRRYYLQVLNRIEEKERKKEDKGIRMAVQYKSASEFLIEETNGNSLR